MFQNAIKSLLVRPVPKADESLMGYIVRLTERNGYETPLWILKMANLGLDESYRSCVLPLSPREGLCRLAHLIGINEEMLAQLTYPHASTRDGVSQYSFFGQPMPQYTIRANRPKICPDCLSELSYCRRLWELSLITTCLKHKRLLIDECPKCKKQISWSRKYVCICTCKFDWRESPASPVEEAEMMLTKHVHWICGVLAGENQLQVPLNPLRKLTLNDLLLPLFFIAGQHKGMSSATSKHLAAAGKNQSFHRILTGAYSVFENWPVNYFEFLDRRRVQERTVTRTYQRMKSALYGEFGSFYYGLHGVLSGRQFDFMRIAFIDHVSQKRLGDHHSSRRPQKSSRALPDGPYVLKSDVRRLLGVDYGWIDHRIRAGEVRSLVRNKGKKRLIFVDLTEITKLKLAQNPC